MDPSTRIENLRDRADELDDGDLIIRFSDRLRLLATDYSDLRHVKLLTHVVRIAEETGCLGDALDDREAAEEIVRWINRSYDNEETNRDYRVALRMFAKHVTGGDEIPEAVEWVSATTSSTYDPTPDPREMLRWDDEIQEMIEAARNSRDEAAIALAFDSGVRSGEFQELRIGDVTDHKHGLQVTVEGKQGRRTVTLIPSVPYVQRWLSNHPRRDDADAPLWCNLETGEELSYKMISRMVSDPAERAGIDKPTTLTNFRKSSAAHLASKGMNQAHLEDHHGWVRGSGAAARYISVFAEDADRELAKIYGREVEEPDDDEIAPIECPRCGKETPRERSLCVWCGQALEPGAAEKAEALDDLLVQEAADSPPDKANEILEYRDRIRDDPEARSEAIERIMDR